MKTSSTQFKVMVDFMERHGDLNKSPNGLQAKLEMIKKWQILANSLNKDPSGDERSIEKWKKVWSDLKNNTKRKRIKIIKGMGLPEHLRPKLVLTDLEQRVINIAGIPTNSNVNDTEIGAEIQYNMDTSVPKDETTAPTTVQFISTDQNSQMFHTESMSEENNSQNYTSTDESSDRSSDASIESHERGVSSSRTRHQNNHRVNDRSRRSKRSPMGPSPHAFEASDSRWRKLFSDLASEHLRLRKRELRQQEKWQNLFERCVDCVEKFVNK